MIQQYFSDKQILQLLAKNLFSIMTHKSGEKKSQGQKKNPQKSFKKFDSVQIVSKLQTFFYRKISI